VHPLKREICLVSARKARVTISIAISDKPGARKSKTAGVAAPKNPSLYDMI